MNGKNALHCVRTGLAAIALLQFAIGAPVISANDDHDHDHGKDHGDDHEHGDTRTPIKHVIVIIGENRSFDHVFATYKPSHGEKVWNLLSEGIVNDDGTPGPNFKKAQQLSAKDGGTDPFLLSPKKSEFPDDKLPVPLAGGPIVPFIPSIAVGQAVENGLAPDYYQFLITGGTGLNPATPDTRILNVSSLPAGPFQLTPGVPYDAYAASPVHRFYQMWQQLNCSRDNATRKNPSGCDSKLFSWVEVTVGAGTNDQKQPANFSTDYSASTITTGEGSTALGFYNVQQGDVPYFKSLADEYAMSDNFHQSVQGGTGANHIMLGHGDALWFSDGEGHPLAPPHKVDVAQGL